MLKRMNDLSISVEASFPVVSVVESKRAALPASLNILLLLTFLIRLQLQHYRRQSMRHESRFPGCVVFPETVGGWLVKFI